MNLYHLRYFVTLAHLEHYTKAADVLAITQPSLSHAISSLEEELGVKLFEKNGRNVSLTKYGKTFLGDVEETLNRLDSSVNGLQLAGKGEGQIDVAFLRTLGVDFVPKIIRNFLTANEGKQINFNLFCDKVLTGDILTGLKEKKYDIGFCSKFDDEPLIEFIPVAILLRRNPRSIWRKPFLTNRSFLRNEVGSARSLTSCLRVSVSTRMWPLRSMRTRLPQDLLPMISASALPRISPSFILWILRSCPLFLQAGREISTWPC